MYGDTRVIRRLAADLRDRADEIRAEADRLVADADSVPWTGLAADAMRRVARDDAAGLRACANRHDDAADALDRHARAVDAVTELIAAAERRIRATVADAGRLLDHVHLPEPGSPGWLHVRLPHLPGL